MDAQAGTSDEAIAARVHGRLLATFATAACAEVLRAEFAGTLIRVALDGKTYIEMHDTHIAGPGTVGVWTKADSVTALDDFSYGPSTR